MIQPILYVTLGALCMGLLARLRVPALLRRAQRLTRKRVEASLPMSLNEIRAGRDQVRARAAVEIRRAELNAKAARDAETAKSIELGHKTALANKQTAAVTERDARIGQLEAERDGLAKSLAEREAELRTANEALAEMKRKSEAQGGELAELARLYESASFLASDRQIELVARESEIENLNGSLTQFRLRAEQADKVAKETATSNTGLMALLDQEKAGAAELQAKVDDALTRLGDREALLEQSAGEIARMREQAVAAPVGIGAEALKPALDPAPVAPIQAEIPLVEAKEPETEAVEPRRAAGDGPDAATMSRDDAVLREQIADLAAKMVTLSAAIDGPDSPIAKALSQAPRPARANGGPSPSLAERIQALQDAAART